jgi:hypothetical protein
MAFREENLLALSIWGLSFDASMKQENTDQGVALNHPTQEEKEKEM